MKRVFVRICKKFLLWYRFNLIADNFCVVVWYRIINMLGLDKYLKKDIIIHLKNGILLNYGKSLDLSAVPVVVEIWNEKIYNPIGYEIKSGDVVVDIGANIGNFAIFALKQGASRVFAFEPIQRNYDLILANININKLVNLEPFLLAVAGKSGMVVMHVSQVDTAHSMSGMIFSQHGNVKVEAITLEEFCQQQKISKIDFLKVDCEGAEYEIFEKISAQMLNLIGKIGIEHHERFMHRDHAEISNRLRDAGFQVQELPDHYIFAKRNESF